ncbi:hypothetical protein [Candidatus Sulfurimonas baltica]|uniref:Uncharacterized protein n=1 Tax=Candidatus Sulfurimonas baltica TaxID=2740404 RepID=A0A7S7RNI4_9BACT|nr:hypothetical protein [Candidatus Sulfurimonas baltica]QOY53322.1 hypothetical protein HUE88_06520 [Candidatus Sulfurimonas baltica]
MSTTTYFEENLYPPKYEDGKADKTKSPFTLDVAVSNFFGDSHQVYLRTTDENRKEITLHLTKEQAYSLAEALESAASYIGYDNT